MLGTDSGVSWSQKGLMNPYSVEGLAALVGALKLQEFSDSEIQIVGRHNPRRLLDLDGEGTTPRK